MNTQNQEIAIFKSSEPEAFARAIALLKSSGIPFRIEENVGGGRIPWRTYLLFVSSKNADNALQQIAEVPSEFIFAQNAKPISAENRSFARMYLILLIVMVIFLVVMVFLKR
ncbi:MAG: hypothetical protein PHX78_11625 [bacterium]|nr:hypothetical protein [bacterium]